MTQRYGPPRIVRWPAQEDNKKGPAVREHDEAAPPSPTVKPEEGSPMSMRDAAPRGNDSPGRVP